MARDRIKSRASFKSEAWMCKRESAGLAEVRASWLCLFGMDLESSDLESGGESGLSMIGGTRSDSEFAVDTIASGPSIVQFAAESPVGSKLPSSDRQFAPDLRPEQWSGPQTLRRSSLGYQ